MAIRRGVCQARGMGILRSLQVVKNTRMEHEILFEMSKLLEKTGLDNPIPTISSANTDQLMETVLINLKSLNARYEKSDALNQVEWLMNTYNIQIDELIERINA